ncbi:flavodoxin family protein [Propionispora hippei]|uniref:NADPH-dependent FMN reductase n=1 Tax=Propionispora hippei DSM 15287 TaxID=1123003 RepID=A0A1M6DLE9_9FIRM|nr:flavodoxin family protein [Propionispora hippei]SHI74134.1 NADPH-dependent FMN reductase [Propionispora hippei DSM 15287]
MKWQEVSQVKKIVAINGSPKGKASNTDVMVSAFLKGAQAAGAETVNIFLAEKDIKHCRGCLACWLITPGQCVIKDAMGEILALCEGADIFVLATPLYFDNISGMLKDFMDRMIVKGDPHFEKVSNGECRHLKNVDTPSAKLVMIANCGFSERSHFQVISHWVNRAALNMKTEVLGEFYAAQGSLLSINTDELRPIIADYLKSLENAGRAIASGQRVSEETKRLLEQNFIPDEVYIQKANRYFDNVLNSKQIKNNEGF